MVSQDSYLSHAVADRQAAGSGSDITLSNRLLANRLNTAIALLVAFLLPRQKRVSRFPLSTTRVKSSELIIRLVSPLSSLFTQSREWKIAASHRYRCWRIDLRRLSVCCILPIQHISAQWSTCKIIYTHSVVKSVSDTVHKTHTRSFSHVSW